MLYHVPGKLIREFPWRNTRIVDDELKMTAIMLTVP